MGYHVDNAVIMAAGTSSRFAPLSFEMPKALIEVRGEVLIERQIRQLQEAGISTIVLVVGYMKERFAYLHDKFGVIIVENKEYLTRNNNSTIFAAKDYIRNSYICSADNYFSENPFETEVEESYYSAVYSNGETSEWCMTYDTEGYIESVSIGGHDAWYMLGHAFWDERFSECFLHILESEYFRPGTAEKLWEKIYMSHLDVLKMKIRKYRSDVIFEFDSIDELRDFDASYVENTRSMIIKQICADFGCEETEVSGFKPIKTDDNAASGFEFLWNNVKYEYYYQTKEVRRQTLCQN